MSASAFAQRQRAAEGHYFNIEDRLHIVRRLERMVEAVSDRGVELVAMRQFALASSGALWFGGGFA